MVAAVEAILESKANGGLDPGATAHTRPGGGTGFRGVEEVFPSRCAAPLNINRANTYRLVMGNPVGAADPSGLSFMRWFSYVPVIGPMAQSFDYAAHGQTGLAWMSMGLAAADADPFADIGPGELANAALHKLAADEIAKAAEHDVAKDAADTACKDAAKVGDFGKNAAESADVKFGNDANQISHAFRHTDAAGLDQEAVQSAIRSRSRNRRDEDSTRSALKSDDSGWRHRCHIYRLQAAEWSGQRWKNHRQVALVGCAL